MLQSMTGYGKAVSEIDGRKISVEIRSLNSKQGEVNLKMPSLLREKEQEIRQIIANQLDRGKVDVLINIEELSPKSVSTLNEEYLKTSYQTLRKIADELNIQQEQWMQVLVNLPEAFSGNSQGFDESFWNHLFSTVEKSIEQLNLFRLKEGEALEKDILTRLQNLKNQLQSVGEADAERVLTFREKTIQKWNELKNDIQMDVNRMEQELFFYLEKIDITEEKTRMLQHCIYFEETLHESSANGRKLGFITQEIGREINTIGSKANHALIQRIVVDMKTELEKIKEQLSNIV